MYLASRFQIALWDSYVRKENSSNNSIAAAAAHPGRLILQGGDWDRYDESVLKGSLLAAIRTGLRDVLKEEGRSAKIDCLRDGTLWSVLEFFEEDEVRMRF